MRQNMLDVGAASRNRRETERKVGYMNAAAPSTFSQDGRIVVGLNLENPGLRD